MTDTHSPEVTEFIRVFARGDFAADVAPSLSCIEVEALAGMFRNLSDPDLAEGWIAAHATGDEPGDVHYLGPDGYIVPIDPAEVTACDSCQ